MNFKKLTLIDISALPGKILISLWFVRKMSMSVFLGQNGEMLKAL